MNGSTDNLASDPERSVSQRVMNLHTARKMLPLVQRIVEDLRLDQQVRLRLQPEMERLDRQRRDLSWPERRRRYEVHDQVAASDQHFSESMGELGELGVVLLDADTGRVGFPTIVNDRPAYFAWWPGENGINSWHFASDLKCRPIPPAWAKVGDIDMSGKT